MLDVEVDGTWGNIGYRFEDVMSETTPGIRAVRAPLLKVSRQPTGEPEIFFSLQGEGHSIGVPTVFLRLALCNLTCVWCDTRYTWDWARYDPRQEIVSLSVDDVEGRIRQYGCLHLIITGGEPMMQQNVLVPLVASLKRRGFYIEVETNGTLSPQPQMREAISQWNVSPKLDNSGVLAGRRNVPEAIETFRDLENAYFKFVIDDRADIDEVCGLVQRYAIPPQRVILMPQGTTQQAMACRGPWVADLCIAHGFRFSPRLHILLWGDKRGR
jgi:organic radical activating enzyme